MAGTNDNWKAGDAYESYMGRWSRPLARSFIRLVLNFVANPGRAIARMSQRLRHGG
jgi:hypothetical protein